MNLLDKLKRQLNFPKGQDGVLQFCLDSAEDIICDLRNSDKVEQKYKTTQISIAIELYNKMGAEGQIGHSEHGIGRSYEKADVSPSLLSRITPVVKTPFSKIRVIDE